MMKRTLSVLAAAAAMGATAHASTLSMAGSLPAASHIEVHFHRFFQGGFHTVPEPASWMLMIVGFGAMALAVRARRRSKAKSEA
jgi:hypothetical protein